jgi:hypothetical protein
MVPQECEAFLVIDGLTVKQCFSTTSGIIFVKLFFDTAKLQFGDHRIFVFTLRELQTKTVWEPQILPVLY